MSSELSQIETIRKEIKAEFKEFRDAMTDLAKSMSDLAISTARYEERAAAQTQRMERIEEVQQEQGKELRKMDGDLTGAIAITKRIGWIVTTATASFITGAMGFMFWLAQRAIGP